MRRPYNFDCFDVLLEKQCNENSSNLLLTYVHYLFAVNSEPSLEGKRTIYDIGLIWPSKMNIINLL